MNIRLLRSVAAAAFLAGCASRQAPGSQEKCDPSVARCDDQRAPGEGRQGGDSLTIGPSGAPLNPAKIAARSMPAIVAVRTPHGLGTGFGVRTDGWIATSLHVVAGAEAVLVSLTDGSVRRVIEIRAFDPARDLVLLKVDGPIAALTLGQADMAQVGEPVVAIGHPMSLEGTVSNGLVSAVRQVDQSLTILQISAPIAPGSSGGPILDEHGAVIGVAAAVMREGQNLNFAIPARYLKRMLRDAGEPIPLAVFAAATRPAAAPGLPEVKRDVPNHPLSVLAGCSDNDMRLIVRMIGEAIATGAPLYNERRFGACYHLYEGTSVDLEGQLSASCRGPKKALRDGRTRAKGIQEPSPQAWAMRDSFDGLIDVIRRKLEISGK